MKPLRPTDFPVDPSRTEAIIQALGEIFDSHSDTLITRDVVVHDTFDWRLHSENSTLTLTTEKARSGAVTRLLGPPELVWCNLDGGEHSTRLLAEERPVPAFAWDFDDAPLRRALEPIIEMRRLLPVVHLTLEGRLVCLLDAEGKTVVRLRFEQPTVRKTTLLDPPGDGGESEPTPLPARLRVEPIRGYAKAEKKTLRRLADEFGLAPVERSLFDEAMESVGLEPGSYSSKVRVRLDPARPAADAMREILGKIFDVMLANKEGTRRDLDSEFLHDFRVAIRRTRSALGQVKDVFPSDLVAHFRNELAWLGRTSGATRDLDVYLLKMPTYRASLSEETGRALGPLRTFLEERQVEEQKALASLLDSDRYRSLEADWRRFLATDSASESAAGEASGDPGSEPRSTNAPANASAPIGKVASARIRKAYRRVIRNGSRIDDASPDQDLHDLRIDCKKLRYLMELFAGLYDKTEIGASIRDLKRLQENLGDFNDYSVQREKLAEFAQEMMEDGSAPAPTFLAMGQLMQRLEEGQTGERHRFASRFERFTQEECRARFTRLFDT